MNNKTALAYKQAIQASGKTIYSDIEVGDSDYWIPTPQLEQLLNEGLIGINLTGLALRTRSKVVNQAICLALGYPVPKSFKKTAPRFTGQQLDKYNQKSTNLQIWNQELSAERRYAVVQISDDDYILKVRVVSGQELSLLDTTGTITKKYQAGLSVKGDSLELISQHDTSPMLEHVNADVFLDLSASPIDEPETKKIISIGKVYSLLSQLVGASFKDPGTDQERNRGAELHRLVCKALGYSKYEDNGQFPDIRHQLLEVKLQTSPTIDLGLVLPNSEDLLDIRVLGSFHPRHCDTRYALFFGVTDGTSVKLTHLFVTTGNDFFTRFRRFEGKVTNGKIQIPLPSNFFGS
jgi:hypothetical protein